MLVLSDIYHHCRLLELTTTIRRTYIKSSLIISMSLIIIGKKSHVPVLDRICRIELEHVMLASD